MWAFLKRIWKQVDEDNIFVWASALAYSWLFAIFPFLILLLSLVPYLPKNARDSAKTNITHSISTVLGKEATTINANLDSLINVRRSSWLWVGLLVSLWVAAGGMTMTMSALDRCYEVKKPRPFYRQRAVALAMTVGVVLCVVLIVVLLPVGQAVGKYAAANGMISWSMKYVFDVARYVISFFFSIAVLAIIYYFGPNVRQKFQILTPGAVFSAVVWFVLDGAFRIYIDRYASYDKTYGTVGGAAILLLFFYIDALVLLIGAEINSEIDFEKLGIAQGTVDCSGKTEKTLAPEL
jgi:membrane protein